MASTPSSSAAPGAIRTAPGTVVLNGDRTDAERLRLVVLNTGDRPVQVGSHVHFAQVNAALAFDREAARGFRLDVPSGTSQRFEPGASREVALVALRGRRVVPGIQMARIQVDGIQADGAGDGEGARATLEVAGG